MAKPKKKIKLKEKKIKVDPELVKKILKSKKEKHQDQPEKPQEIISAPASNLEVREIPVTTIPVKNEDQEPVRQLDDLDRIRSFSSEDEKQEQDTEIYKSDIYQAGSIYDEGNLSDERTATDTRTMTERRVLTNQDVRRRTGREESFAFKDPHVRRTRMEGEIEYDPGQFKELHERSVGFSPEDRAEEGLKKYKGKR